MTWKPFREPRWETDSVTVKQSLGQLARRLGAGAPDVMQVVFDQWAETVGREVADHAKPLSLTDGVLTVIVEDHMWMAQLKWMTRGIAESINRKVGSEAIARVELRLPRRK